MVALALKPTDYFETPKKEYLDACYFFGIMPTLDVCATLQNTKCHNYFSSDALEKDWNQYYDTVAYMNPPYSQSKLWVKYAYMQHVKHNMTILALLQSHTGTSYFVLCTGTLLYKVKLYLRGIIISHITYHTVRYYGTRTHRR